MDADRQRRLHIENRLQELRAKHGVELEREALPDWLDSYEGFLTQRSAAEQPISRAPVRPAPTMRANGRAASAGVPAPSLGSGPVRQNADFADLDV